MTTTAEFDELMSRALESMWGSELAEILDAALAMALEQDDEAAEYRVRLLMGNNAQMSGDTDALLSNFAWCLAKHDEDPLRFPNEPDPGSDLMWQFKWMVGVLGADPQFTKEQIDAVLADMEQHYRRAGLGQSAVAMARFESAFHDGHLHEARQAFSALNATEPDEYSHCDACVRSVSMDYYFSVGQEDKGLAAFNEIMAGGFTCGEEPENAMSVALLPLLRTGELGKVASLHRRSYRDARENADNLGIISNHLVFCAVTGNEARGVALAERHLAWLAHDPLAHRSHLGFLSALGLLLEKVVAADHGDLPVRGSDSSLLNPFFGVRTGTLTAAELAPLCWQAADSLAADFDARNGNDWHAAHVARRRAMVAETHPLSLGTEAFATPAPPAVAEPRNSDEWRTRTVDLAIVGQVDAALAAYAAGVRAATEPQELAALHKAAIGVYSIYPSEKNTALLQETIALRAAALRAAGDPDLAALVERTAEVLAAPGDGNDAKLALLDAETLTMSGHPHALYLLHSERAYLLAEHADADTARAALNDMEQALNAWAADSTAPSATEIRRGRAQHSKLMLHVANNSEDLEEIKKWQASNLEYEISIVGRATNLGLRARIAAQDGRLDDALVDAEAATELFLSLNAREAVAQSVQLSAAILADLGRTEEHRARLRFGITQAQLAESPIVVGLAYSLARNLVEHGSNDEAIELLDETLNTPGLTIGDHDRAELYDLLGNALRAEGELGGALNAWRLGIESFVAHQEIDRAAQLHLAISATYQSAGYLADAAQAARNAVELLAAAMAAGDAAITPEYLISAHLQLAEALSLDGDEEAQAAIETAQTLARQAESEHQLAEIQLIRARDLFRSGDVDGAVAQALQASSALEEIDDGGQQSVLALLQAAHMLDNAKRHDDAVSIYRSVLEELQGDAQGAEIVRHQLADCLEAAGRGAEALAVRTNTP